MWSRERSERLADNTDVIQERLNAQPVVRAFGLVPLMMRQFNTSLDRQVVCGQHGWWQACAELGLPGYPPFGPGSANLNLVLRQQPSDPVSGSSPLRASVCDVAVALPDPD